MAGARACATRSGAGEPVVRPVPATVRRRPALCRLYAEGGVAVAAGRREACRTFYRAIVVRFPRAWQVNNTRPSYFGRGMDRTTTPDSGVLLVFQGLPDDLVVQIDDLRAHCVDLRIAHHELRGGLRIFQRALQEVDLRIAQARAGIDALFDVERAGQAEFHQAFEQHLDRGVVA